MCSASQPLIAVYVASDTCLSCGTVALCAGCGHNLACLLLALQSIILELLLVDSFSA